MDNKELARRELQLYTAYKMGSVSRRECKAVITRLVSKPSEQTALINDMIRCGDLVPFDGFYFTLPLSKYLDLLSELSLSSSKKFQSIVDCYPKFQYSWGNKPYALSNLLLEWKFNHHIIPYNWLYDRDNRLLLGIVERIPFHSEWSGIMSDIDSTMAEIITNIAQYKLVTNLDRESIQLYKKNIIDKSTNNTLLEEIYNSTYHFFSHILPGNIQELNQLPATQTFHYLATQAISLQYAKEYSKAVAMWRKVLKEDFISGELMSNPLYALFYVKALSCDKKQSSINRLDKVTKHFGQQHHLKYLAVKIYLNLINEKSNTNCVDAIINSYLVLSPLDLVLAVMVILHYNIAKLPAEIVTMAEEYISDDQFLLLQFEATSSLPRYIANRDVICSKMQVEPIFERYVEVEPWQKCLNDLGSIVKANKPNNQVDKTTSIGESRIVYLLDNYDNFQPRLQKSKNGTTWSKGRNVALSSLQNHSSEGMTEVDKVVAKEVKCYDSWSGGRTYTLNGINVYKALVGHPLVFSSDNSDVSITIVGDKPYIKVENFKNGGFLVTSNVGEFHGGYNTVVTKESDVLYRVITVTSLQRRILEIFKKQSIFPSQAKETLSKMVVDTASIITIHSDVLAKNDNLKSIKGSLRITAQFLPISDGVKFELLAKPIEDFDQYCKPAEGQESFIAQYNGESVLVERNLKGEKKNIVLIHKIIENIIGESIEGNSLFIDNLYDTLPLIEKLQEQENIVRIEWPKGAKLKIRGAVDFKNLNLSLRSAAGWFEVDGDVKVDKSLQVTLAELLERNRESKGRFVELTKGEFLALSDSLRRQLNALDASIAHGKKGMQLSQFSSGIVSALESDGVKVKKDTAFQKLQTRIKEAETQEFNVPTTLQAELRDYQIDGFKWISRLAEWGAGACLADDMGLGKTVQSIAVLLNRAERGASLIVAPASVVHNWQSELERFAPSLKSKVLHDNIPERESIVNEADKFDIVITTYGLLNRIEGIITAKEWNVILLDEAHNIKNRDTKSSKVAMNLKGDFRLILTGTPIQNHLGEIWNLFNFTNRGLLGSFDHFTQKFIIPIEQNGDKLRQRELKRVLQPFMLRRTKSEVLDELPTKTEIVHRIELSDKERALYENIRLEAIEGLESGELNPIQSLAEITKLRQAACHPSLIDDSLGLDSAKTLRFVELVTELIENRHRALVFSQFTSFLSLIKEALDRKGVPYLYMDGSTPIKEREKLVQTFQHGESPLFLISLKAGGVGLNLTAADYVIHLDPWWNPAIEDQASDRSHRIGQTRPVTIYRLISQDTIEEKIIELHRNKRSLADSLLEGSNMSHKLSREDMLALISDGLLMK